ncbi:MAG: MoxR family ATPase [Pseudomonadota bacterium]
MTHHQVLFAELGTFLATRVVGQAALVQRLLIALLAHGHLLVEGVPGLAKTRAIRVLGDAIEGDFQRIQFTPDLLPADLTGTEIYRNQTGEFEFKAGPLFHNLILADEINRAPAKVQSALLEAMSEGDISVGDQTYGLPSPFLVMATRNPLEQAGTYALPEAQLDRFLLHVTVDYPSVADELRILDLVRAEDRGEVTSPGRSATPPLVGLADVEAARAEVLALNVNDNMKRYMVSLVAATRQGELAEQLAYGCSPRATLSLDIASRAHAWLAGRDYLSPADVQAVVHDVFRHRLALDFDAEDQGLTVDAVVDAVLDAVSVP